MTLANQIITPHRLCARFIKKQMISLTVTLNITRGDSSGMHHHQAVEHNSHERALQLLYRVPNIECTAVLLFTPQRVLMELASQDYVVALANRYRHDVAAIQRRLPAPAAFLSSPSSSRCPSVVSLYKGLRVPPFDRSPLWSV
jgi:hypothetical protein